MYSVNVRVRLFTFAEAPTILRPHLCLNKCQTMPKSARKKCGRKYVKDRIISLFEITLKYELHTSLDGASEFQNVPHLVFQNAAQLSTTEDRCWCQCTTILATGRAGPPREEHQAPHAQPPRPVPRVSTWTRVVKGEPRCLMGLGVHLLRSA